MPCSVTSTQVLDAIQQPATLGTVARKLHLDAWDTFVRLQRLAEAHPPQAVVQGDQWLAASSTTWNTAMRLKQTDHQLVIQQVYGGATTFWTGEDWTDAIEHAEVYVRPDNCPDTVLAGDGCSVRRALLTYARYRGDAHKTTAKIKVVEL